MGGELGGVIVDKFCVDPGGLQLGVIIWESATGEVERARGDTGVCFLRDGTLTPFWNARAVVIRSTLLSFIDSDRRGEEGSFGEGVPLELEKEWLSSDFVGLNFRTKREDLLVTRLECLRRSLPMRLPSQGSRLRLSCRILVFSSGMVFKVSTVLSRFLESFFE